MFHLSHLNQCLCCVLPAQLHTADRFLEPAFPELQSAQPLTTRVSHDDQKLGKSDCFPSRHTAKKKKPPCVALVVKNHEVISDGFTENGTESY